MLLEPTSKQRTTLTLSKQLKNMHLSLCQSVHLPVAIQWHATSGYARELRAGSHSVLSRCCRWYNRECYSTSHWISIRLLSSSCVACTTRGRGANKCRHQSPEWTLL